MTDFGIELKIIMRTHSLTANDVASRLRINVGTVYRWLRGDTEPPMAWLVLKELGA